MSWNEYDTAMEKGPFSGFLKWFLLFLAISATVGGTGYVLGWFEEAGVVAQKELGATAALHKYEWFIEQSTMIAKMDKDVEMFRERVAEVKTKYEMYGEPKSWTLDIRMMFLMESRTADEDLIAVISQRNNLVREYNAASSKFNWSLFKTRPDAPQVSYEELVVR